MLINIDSIKPIRRNCSTLILSICASCIFLLVPQEVIGQVKVGSILFPTLLMNHTAASNGMGGAYVTDVDENTAFHNPGAQGVFHLDHILAVTAPNSRNWFKGFGDDIKLKTFGGSIGLSRTLSANETHRPLRISVSAAFARTRLDFGISELREPDGTITGAIEPFDEVDNYTASVGLEYFARVGFGVRTQSHKQKYISITGSSAVSFFREVAAKATSIGAYGEITIRFDQQGVGIGQKTSQRWSVSLTPALGYIKSIGGSNNVRLISAPDTVPSGISRAIEIEPPKFEIFGASVTARLSKNAITYFSVRYAKEQKEIDVVTNPTIKNPTEHHGVELGLLGAFYYRIGILDDLGFLRSRLSADGYGFRLRGILDWLEASGRLPAESSTTGWLLRRIDIRYDKANRNLDPAASALNTEFMQIVFSL